MSIIKPNYTNNPSENTKLFLENVIGHYIKIIIHDNKPHIENITNELLMCFDNALYRGHIAIPINIIKMIIFFLRFTQYLIYQFLQQLHFHQKLHQIKFLQKQ